MKTFRFYGLTVALDVTCRGAAEFTYSPTSAPTVPFTDINSSAPYSDNYSVLSSSANYTHPDYPDCDGQALFIADGWCDRSSNNAQCGWDGGDCCECSCQSNSTYDCGIVGYSCEDPDAPFWITGCLFSENFTIPQVSSCSQDIQVEWVVEDTADATMLAEGTRCSGGGVLEVEWRGHVVVATTIYVLDGTSLRITGLSDAIADGGETVQIFLIFHASLHLNSVDIINGAGTVGGAIIAAEGSQLFVDSVTFSSNTAQTFGGSIYLLSSNAELMSTKFESNGAEYGGAMFVSNSTVIGNTNTSFISNNANVNGGALFVGESSYFGLNMQPVFPVSTKSYYSSDDSTTYDGPGIEVGWIAIEDKGETIFADNIAGGSGGAIFALACGIAWSGNTSLQRNKAQYGGALYLENGVDFQTQGTTTFASNNAIFDGGAVGAGPVVGTVTGHSSLSITNGSATFAGNVCGGNGGAIHLTGINLIVDANVSFSRNDAVSFGGALYASLNNVGPTLNGVDFIDNSAEAGGAVFFSAVGTSESSATDETSIYSYASTFIGCRFDGNSALSTGGAIHSTAGNDFVRGTTFTGNSAEIGGAMRVSGTISLFNSSFVENTSEEGGGPGISNGGVILRMVGVYFSGNRYHCSSDAFMDLNETTVSDSRYEIVCDGCGEECIGCMVENDYKVPVCEDLFDHADSLDGTATLETLVLEAGYWRATTTSRDVLACFNEKACLGGVTGNPGYCSAGYEGPYCAVCSQGYGGTLSYHCSKCSEASSIVSYVCTFIIAGLLGLLFAYCMVSIEGVRTPWVSFDRVKAVLPLQSVKIIVISWQIVTQFSMVANVAYPNLYKRFLDNIALVNFDINWIPSAGCIVDVDFHMGLIAATVGPLVLVALLGVTYTIAMRCSRGSERAVKAIRKKHANAAIVIALLMYSSASSAAFRAFACDPLDDGKMYLRSDYRIECRSPTHKAFQIYAAFMIVVYPFGIPALFAFLLFRNRKVLTSTSLRNNRSNLLQYSTSNLWKPYKPSAFYYEVVECGRRVMLTGVVVFIYPNSAAQIAVTLAIAFVFAFTCERLDPYDSQWDRRVSRMAQIMVVLTMFEALLTKVDVSSEGVQSQRLFAGVLVGAHVIMVLTVVVEAFTLICSVRQVDTPLSRSRSSITVIVPDDDSSFSKYSSDA